MIVAEVIKNFFQFYTKTSFKSQLGGFISVFFQNSLFFYLLFSLLEYFRPGCVSRYFPLNFLFSVVLVFGLLTALYPEEFLIKIKEKYHAGKYFSQFLVLVVFNLLVFNKLKVFGNAVLILFAISFIFSLSILLSLIFGIINERQE